MRVPVASGTSTPSQDPSVGARSYGVDGTDTTRGATPPPQRIIGTCVSYSHGDPWIEPRPPYGSTSTPKRGTTKRSPERPGTLAFHALPTSSSPLRDGNASSTTNVRAITSFHVPASSWLTIPNTRFAPGAPAAESAVRSSQRLHPSRR